MSQDYKYNGTSTCLSPASILPILILQVKESKDMAMSVLNSYRTCDLLDGSMQTEEADRPLPFISLMEFVSKIYQVENYD